MMGRTHALSGGVAWMGVMMPINEYVDHLTPFSAGLGLVVATGAAMLPDTDHHNGTIANTYGWFTRKLCQGVAVISGGHRKGTHSFLGTAVFATSAAAMSTNVWTRALVVWLCFGIAVRALWKRPKHRPNGKLDYSDVSGLVNALVAAVVALALVWLTRNDVLITTVAVTVGYLTHLVGDTFTKGGVPWMYPFSKTRLRLTTMATGGPGEKVFVVLLYVTLGVEVLYLTRGAIS